MVKNSPAIVGDARDADSSLDWENPLESEMTTHSALFPGEFRGQRAWWITVHGVTKNQI